jgi:hypothetical protein
MLIRPTSEAQWDALWLHGGSPAIDNWTGLRAGDTLEGWEFIEGVEDAMTPRRVTGRGRA